MLLFWRDPHPSMYMKSILDNSRKYKDADNDIVIVISSDCIFETIAIMLWLA